MMSGADWLLNFGLTKMRRHSDKWTTGKDGNTLEPHHIIITALLAECQGPWVKEALGGTCYRC